MILVMADFVAAALISVILVAWLRQYALQRDVIDRPGKRSSHTVPTPRGGGAGLVGAALLVFVSVRHDSLTAAWYLALAGVLLAAAIGWIDDHRSLGVMPRLGVHLIAAICVVPLALAGLDLEPGVLLLAVMWWTFWGIATINVANFMDGTDGIIGVQVLICASYFLTLVDPDHPAAVFAACLAGAAVGFLAWNWAPARIFLGDVGSGAAGLLLVCGGAAVFHETGNSVIRIFLPLLPLFLDASWTLVRRAHRGERLAEAHREHLYQRMANGTLGHAPIAVGFGALAVVGAVVGRASGAWFSVNAPTYAAVLVAAYAIADRRWSAAMPRTIDTTR